MSRAYLRLDPGFYERKAIDQGYPLPAVAALIGVLCLADSQPQRGSFRDEKLLKVLLGPGARWVGLLIERGDLIQEGQRLRVDGWEIWQEGDLTVHDRMIRFRNKHNAPNRNESNGADRNGASSHAGDAHGRSAEALAGQSGSDSGSPLREPTDEGPTKTREELIAEQRRLLSHPHAAIAHAAEKALRKLGAA